MIVTRTPVRIPLGGGGTDLPSYYTQYGGFLISAAIDKYIYITLNKRFEKSIRVSYSSTEIVDSVEEIKHPIVREALKLLKIESGIEITSIGDVPSNTGLGTSSAFTVGLLNALHTYKNEKVNAKDLAEEACFLEIELLKEPIGKQDQYLSAYGGVQCLEIDRLGNVKVTPLHLSEDAIDQLESNTLLFYTGIRRSASEVLAPQNKGASLDNEKVIENMHKIKEIGLKIKKSFEEENLSHFGGLLDVHWQTKKNLSSKITQSQIDQWYQIARKSGALGGKLMGAGGGGFFMFYCDNGKNGFRKIMEQEGLREMRFRLDWEGSKVLVNI
jgi:D-glycero-alpha-D-manno-heptose-7-phosphate kinase